MTDTELATNSCTVRIHLRWAVRRVLGWDAVLVCRLPERLGDEAAAAVLASHRRVVGDTVELDHARVVAFVAEIAHWRRFEVEQIDARDWPTVVAGAEALAAYVGNAPEMLIGTGRAGDELKPYSCHVAGTLREMRPALVADLLVTGDIYSTELNRDEGTSTVVEDSDRLDHLARRLLDISRPEFDRLPPSQRAEIVAAARARVAGAHGRSNS